MCIHQVCLDQLKLQKRHYERNTPNYQLLAHSHHSGLKGVFRLPLHKVGLGQRQAVPQKSISDHFLQFTNNQMIRSYYSSWRMAVITCRKNADMELFKEQQPLQLGYYIIKLNLFLLKYNPALHFSMNR